MVPYNREEQQENNYRQYYQQKNTKYISKCPVKHQQSNCQGNKNESSSSKDVSQGNDQDEDGEFFAKQETYAKQRRQSSTVGDDSSLTNDNTQFSELDEPNSLVTIPCLPNDYNPQFNSKAKPLSTLDRISLSKSLQDRYKNKETRNLIFESEVKPNIKEYCTDKYYFFFMNLILEEGDLEHKNYIFEKMYEHRLEIITNIFGYRIFTSAIELSQKISSEKYHQFAKFLVDPEQMSAIFFDKFASYVIQKCQELFEDEYLEKILNFIQENLFFDKKANKKSLCSDQFGCLIVQKVVEINNKKQSPKIKEQIEKILEQVSSKSMDLCKNQFSNYIIQQIIEKGSLLFKDTVFNLIIDNFVEISLDKFGSNAAERVVVFSSDFQRKKIWKIVEKNNNNYLQNMVNDKYANYVVQSIYNNSSKQVQRDIQNMLNLWHKERKLKPDTGMHVFITIQNKILKEQAPQYLQDSQLPNFYSFMNQTQQCQNFMPFIFDPSFQQLQYQQMQQQSQQLNKCQKGQQQQQQFCPYLSYQQQQYPNLQNVLQNVFPPNFKKQETMQMKQSQQGQKKSSDDYLQQIVYQKYDPSKRHNVQSNSNKQKSKNLNHKKYQNNV